MRATNGHQPVSAADPMTTPASTKNMSARAFPTPRTVVTRRSRSSSVRHIHVYSRAKPPPPPSLHLPDAGGISQQLLDIGGFVEEAWDATGLSSYLAAGQLAPPWWAHMEGSTCD